MKFNIVLLNTRPDCLSFLVYLFITSFLFIYIMPFLFVGTAPTQEEDIPIAQTTVLDMVPNQQRQFYPWATRLSVQFGNYRTLRLCIIISISILLLFLLVGKLSPHIIIIICHFLMWTNLIIFFIQFLGIIMLL